MGNKGADYSFIMSTFNNHQPPPALLTLLKHKGKTILNLFKIRRCFHLPFFLASLHYGQNERGRGGGEERRRRRRKEGTLHWRTSWLMKRGGGIYLSLLLCALSSWSHSRQPPPQWRPATPSVFRRAEMSTQFVSASPCQSGTLLHIGVLPLQTTVAIKTMITKGEITNVQSIHICHLMRKYLETCSKIQEGNMQWTVVIRRYSERKDYSTVVFMCSNGGPISNYITATLQQALLAWHKCLNPH